MTDTSKQGIYIEIAEQLMERIVEGDLPTGARVPSVRETAMLMGVTPSTAAHAHDFLKNLGVIEPQRGTGSLVCPDGPARCRDYIMARFLENELPLLKRRLGLLGISPAGLAQLLTTPETETENKP